MPPTARELRLARHKHVRRKLRGTEARPRLAVFRSLSHIYAQVVDDGPGHTLASASSLEIRGGDHTAPGPKTAVARQVGALLAQRAREQGIVRVAFDRGGYKYHGRVKALAEGARAEGLEL